MDANTLGIILGSAYALLVGVGGYFYKRNDKTNDEQTKKINLLALSIAANKTEYEKSTASLELRITENFIKRQELQSLEAKVDAVHHRLDEMSREFIQAVTRIRNGK